MKKKGLFFTLVDRMADMVILGILWILTSLPVITIGPASCALYYAVVKSIRYQEGKIIPSFFHSFKRNFRPGCLLSIYMVLFAIFFLVSLKTSWGEFLVVPVIITGLFLIGIAIYSVAVLSRFVLSASQCLKAGMFFTVRYLGKTGLLLITFVLCMVVAGIYPFSLPLLVGLYAYYCSYFIEKIFQEYMNLSEEERGEWYFGAFREN